MCRSTFSFFTSWTLWGSKVTRFNLSVTSPYVLNQPDLEWDLYKNVYGQHLAQDIVSEEVARFLQNKSPERPLVLSFHGSSGTGKTLVSSILVNHLYGSAMSSPFVHTFVPALHFPSSDRVQQYRVSQGSKVRGDRQSPLKQFKD